MTDLAKRLDDCANKKDWDTLTSILKPKDFCIDVPRTLIDFINLVKVAKILSNNGLDLPESTKMILLKCLTNSCMNGYLQKSYIPPNSQESTEDMYSLLDMEVLKWNEDCQYSYDINFPYDGVVRWAIKAINEYSSKPRLMEDEKEVLRLSLQFLCNFSTFAFKVSTSKSDEIMNCIHDAAFKKTITTLVGHDHAPIARAACAYVHNIIKELRKEFYGTIDKKELTIQLIKSTISDIQAALDTIIMLLKESNYLKEIYDEINIDDKLYLLDIIHQEVRSHSYNEQDLNVSWLPYDAVEFLADKFKKTSDLILKTVDSYVNDLEPTEVIILLDILGVLTSKNSEECKQLQEDKSLLINCIFLLKAVHMSGKECNNCFTPIQNLGQLVLKDNCCTEDKEENGHVCSKKIQSHPAFGFKAALIRVIGNLIHKNEKNQNIVRENDGIPLILDCSNIDARNPLIIQWVTLAIKNLCENNLENQDVIRNCSKIGVVENSIIKELGLTLNDSGDGNAVGIMPMPKGN